MASETDPGGLEELGTPREVRESRPALYPEHAALDKQARAHPEVRADYGPDDSKPPARRGGLIGLWNSIAYGVQYAMLFVWGAGEQSRRADPIEKLKRRYGREQRDH
jgi:hypothetical protein